jgi:hypothetical protein
MPALFAVAPATSAGYFSMKKIAKKRLTRNRV